MIAKHSIKFSSLFVFVTLGNFGCTKSTSLPSNQIVVKVDDKKLPLGEFRRELNQRVNQLDPLVAQTPKQLDTIKNEIAEEFILQSLVDIFSKEQGLVVKKEQLEEEIKSTVKGYPDDLTFQRSLSDEGISYADWQKSVKQSLQQKLIIQNLSRSIGKVTEEEKKEFYRTHQERFKEKEQIDIRQIVLDSESSGKKVEADWRAGRPTAELAKKYSITPDGKLGGDLGWIEKGSFEIFDALFDKPIGYKSPLTKSPFGYHLIEIKAKKAARLVPYNEVALIIERELKQQKEQTLFSQWLEERLRKAKVFKDEELIRSLMVEVKQE